MLIDSLHRFELPCIGGCQFLAVAAGFHAAIDKIGFMNEHTGNIAGKSHPDHRQFQHDVRYASYRLGNGISRAPKSVGCRSRCRELWCAKENIR